MDFKHPRELRKLHQKYQKKAHDSQPVWDSTFKDDERPNLYKQSAAGDVFPAVTDVNTFISQLADPGQLSQKELFVALENSHLALQAAQDEYLAIEKVLRHMQGSDTDDLHDPQQLEDFELFDEKKKARLYGYNLSTELVSGMDPRTEDEKLPKVWQVPASKPDLLKTECDRLLFVQNPFHQPGFVPTKDEATNIRKAIKDGERGYLDGFAPFTRRGKQMVPQLYRKRNVYEPQPVTGVRRQTRSQAREERMEAFGPSRAASSERETDFDTKTRRSTRRTGIRTPRTREASVTPAGSPASRRRKREPLPPSTLSAAVSPAGSPASKRRRLEPVPQAICQPQLLQHLKKLLHPAVRQPILLAPHQHRLRNDQQKRKRMLARSNGQTRLWWQL